MPVLQAGSKPCCPCPGLLSSPWACIRHTAVPCRHCPGTSTGAAPSAGQTGVPVQWWLCACPAALAAHTDRSPHSILSQCTPSLKPWCAPSTPSQPVGRAGRRRVCPGIRVPRCQRGQRCAAGGRGRSLHQTSSLTRGDGAERVSHREGGMGELGEGSERLGSSLGAEQQTGLLLTITPVPSNLAFDKLFSDSFFFCLFVSYFFFSPSGATVAQI